ncbi:hypothetical protein Pst134EB_012522 [Puccinia striiformis f. sp. tritici]|nr:hypothetical protein Pst134EB_012522 [Puccinia striiformis f. sp. tritici]
MTVVRQPSLILTTLDAVFPSSLFSTIPFSIYLESFVSVSLFPSLLFLVLEVDISLMRGNDRARLDYNPFFCFFQRSVYFVSPIISPSLFWASHYHKLSHSHYLPLVDWFWSSVSVPFFYIYLLHPFIPIFYRQAFPPPPKETTFPSPPEETQHKT